MTDSSHALGITDVVLRDAHQSLFATRLRLEDMLPIADKLDQVGYWSVETWGGATFDACIRYLGEDPWHRIRSLKAAMPNTPQQMLLRGQNLLGYRHYADDVVKKFVERAAINGVDVFRVFDAMNDTRNLETAIKAVLENDSPCTRQPFPIPQALSMTYQCGLTKLNVSRIWVHILYVLKIWLVFLNHIQHSSWLPVSKKLLISRFKCTLMLLLAYQQPLS